MIYGLWSVVSKVKVHFSHPIVDRTWHLEGCITVQKFYRNSQNTWLNGKLCGVYSSAEILPRFREYLVRRDVMSCKILKKRFISLLTNHEPEYCLDPVLIFVSFLFFPLQLYHSGEAELVIRYLQILLSIGVPGREIAVISPYYAQVLISFSTITVLDLKIVLSFFFQIKSV